MTAEAFARLRPKPADLAPQTALRRPDKVEPSIDLAADEATPLTDDNLNDFELNESDRRKLVKRQICERRGQRTFRDAMRILFDNQCAISGCKVLHVLEAAHIMPYRGEEDNHAKNGLLLRADLHTLFDLDLLGIEPETLLVRMHKDIIEEYGEFEGRPIRCKGNRRPSPEALRKRFDQFKRRRDA